MSDTNLLGILRLPTSLWTESMRLNNQGARRSAYLEAADRIESDAARIVELQAEVARIKELVSAQAEDGGLWFHAETAPEAYLQQALRKLHAAIGGEQETKRAETTLHLENGSTIKFRGTP